MGRRKRHVKTMGSWQPYIRSDALQSWQKTEEGAGSEVTFGCAASQSLSSALAKDATSTRTGDVGNADSCLQVTPSVEEKQVVGIGVNVEGVESVDRVQSLIADAQPGPTEEPDLYSMSTEELYAELRRIRARRQQLEPILRQQEMLRAVRRARIADYRAAQEEERQWQANARLLDDADALHGRGLIQHLEERWTNMSMHPHISLMGRWERWAILRDEHADELQAVVVDGEQLITEDILDNLVAILKDLHRKCWRNQGPLALGMRLWIEAGQLGKHGDRVLMALCRCYGIAFICFDNGIIKSSQEQLIKRKTALDEFNKTYTPTATVLSRLGY